MKRLSCHISQEVCPFSRSFSSTASEASYASRGPGELPHGVEEVPGETSSHPGTNSPRLMELLEMALDPEAWESFSRGSAIRRAGRAGFARNVCVSLGNWGSPDALPVLTQALADPDPLVRGHAAWALGRVGGAAAGELLSSAASSEQDAWALAEIVEARSGSSGRSLGESGEGAR